MRKKTKADGAVTRAQIHAACVEYFERRWGRPLSEVDRAVMDLAGARWAGSASSDDNEAHRVYREMRDACRAAAKWNREHREARGIYARTLQIYVPGIVAIIDRAAELATAARANPVLGHAHGWDPWLWYMRKRFDDGALKNRDLAVLHILSTRKVPGRLSSYTTIAEVMAAGERQMANVLRRRRGSSATP